VAGVPQQNDRVALGCVVTRLGVHLGDQGAGRIDCLQIARRSALPHRRADSVGGEDDARTVRDFFFTVDEDRTAAFEVAYDVNVVHDLLSDIDRRAPTGERLLDRIHCTFDPGAVAARRHQDKPSHAKPATTFVLPSLGAFLKQALVPGRSIGELHRRDLVQSGSASPAVVAVTCRSSRRLHGSPSVRSPIAKLRERDSRNREPPRFTQMNANVRANRDTIQRAVVELGTSAITTAVRVVPSALREPWQVSRMRWRRRTP
jgi:hypothetical protein